VVGEGNVEDEVRADCEFDFPPDMLLGRISLPVFLALAFGNPVPLEFAQSDGLSVDEIQFFRVLATKALLFFLGVLARAMGVARGAVAATTVQ